MGRVSGVCWFGLAILNWNLSLGGFFHFWRSLPLAVSPYVDLVEMIVMISSYFFIFFSYANGRNEPRRLVGCHVKWVYNLIIVCTAIIVGKCHGYNGYINIMVAMVGFNGEFHALAKLWNIADVGFFDMFLGVLMQIIIFFMVDKTYVVLILVVMLCGGIIYYQYCSYSYSTPTTCVLPKEEDLKDLNPPPQLILISEFARFTCCKIAGMVRAAASGLCWFGLAILNWGFSLVGFFHFWKRFPFAVSPYIEGVECVIMLTNLIIIVLFYVHGRYEPRRLLGCHVKLVYNLIIVCTAITVRKCNGYEGNIVLSMVGFNGEFHALAKLWNFADVGLLDMLLGVLMQIMIFFMGDETYVFILVVMLCGGFIYYQYCSYSTPASCVLPKEEDLKNLNLPV